MSSPHSSSVNYDHSSLIRRQFLRIEELENELARLRRERDGLLSENERLVFQLQCLTVNVNQNKNHLKHESKGGAINTQLDSNLSYIDKSRQSISNSSNINSNTIPYELSQQLLDRRVTALERKYGGIVAREAAIRIQRAYRTYRLQKRFQSIAIQALRDGKQNHAYNLNCQNKRFSSVSSNTTSSSIASNDDTIVSDDFSHAHSLIGTEVSATIHQQFECQRKRQYRVGLNLFNKKGIQYLIEKGFLERGNSIEIQALNVARFLLTRKGISKQMIGEYISTNQPFNLLVLKHFSCEIDLAGLSLDIALRKFQTYFRFPGEAQKIERLVDCFASRFIECNSNSESRDQQLSRDSVFILSFAIIMLNTDLHVPTNSKSRMTSQQWIHNLSGVFSEGNLSEQFLLDIYQRIKTQELRTGADHVTQVQKVQSAIVGKDVPNLCLPHRRLVCYCRLYEIRDLNKKERPGQHQREVFLFNDLLLITKLTSRGRSGQTAEYSYRSSISLEGLSVTLFKSLNHFYGIRLSRRVDDKLVIMFNARNELDQKRFCDDLKESILEMDEMEQLRITKSNSLLHLSNNSLLSKENVAAIERKESEQMLSQSLNESSNRRKSSSGSLDSGLSLPSRDHSPQQSTQSQNKTESNH